MKILRKTPIRAVVRKDLKYLIGIDEVGRGPLAGPVTVCACAIPFSPEGKASKGFVRKLARSAASRMKKLTDSKGLTEKDREAWNHIIRSRAKSHDGIFFQIKSATAKRIDEKGIAVCIRSLIASSLAALQKKHGIKPDECLVLLDGGLKAPEAFVNQETHIKGDVRFPVISFASILAKVHRDAFMKKISSLRREVKTADKGKVAAPYAVYGFNIHKGYGTLAHRNAIKKHGLSDMHRKSFCKNILPQ